MDVIGLGYVLNEENINNITCSSRNSENISTLREPEHNTNEQRQINFIVRLFKSPDSPTGSIRILC